MEKEVDYYGGYSLNEKIAILETYTRLANTTVNHIGNGDNIINEILLIVKSIKNSK